MKITNYAELMNEVFNNMVQIKLPEFWDEDAYQVVSENWSDLIEEDFKDVDDDIDFSEFENDWINEYLGEYYVSYAVSSRFYDLEKLQQYHVPVFWVDDLEAYVFLQGWFGMSAKMIETDLIDTKNIY